MSPRTTRKRRSDADLNRLRILRAARHAYASEGTDVPVRTIADRAGLGAATLYRHFPTRSDLLRAVLAERVAACEADLAAARAEPDAWVGLCRVIRRFARTQLTDRALNQTLLSTPDGPWTQQRRAHSRALDDLVARAAPVLREGVSADDVRAGLLAIVALGALPTTRADDTVHRLTDILIAGLRRAR